MPGFSAVHMAKDISKELEKSEVKVKYNINT